MQKQLLSWISITGGILKEDGELSKTFSLNQDSPKISVPVKKTVLSTQDEFDDYRDLLIDVLITRNPLKMSNTLKTSSLLQKVLNIASLKDGTPGVISNGDEPLSSFVVEKRSVLVLKICKHCLEHIQGRLFQTRQGL